MRRWTKTFIFTVPMEKPIGTNRHFNRKNKSFIFSVLMEKPIGTPQPTDILTVKIKLIPINTTHRHAHPNQLTF
jgi:hypothetical protein